MVNAAAQEMRIAHRNSARVGRDETSSETGIYELLLVPQAGSDDRHIGGAGYETLRAVPARSVPV